MREKIIFTSAKIFVVMDNGETYGTCFSVRGENRYKIPLTEKAKSEDKLFGLNKIFLEIKKMFGLRTAKQSGDFKEHKPQEVHIILLTDIGEEIHGVYTGSPGPYGTFKSYSVINGEKHPLRLTRMLSEQMTVTYYDFYGIVNNEADKSLSIGIVDKISKIFRRNGRYYERGGKHYSSVSVIGTP